MDSESINHIRNFVDDLTDNELIAVVEAARIGLASTDIAGIVCMNMGDGSIFGHADCNNLQHKCHNAVWGNDPTRDSSWKPNSGSAKTHKAT